MRRALRALTHGVYVLSVQADNHDNYVVLSLVMQCSVQPPRIALALATNARILTAFRSAGGGALSILDASERTAVRRYGAPGGMRHRLPDVARTTHDHPVPPEASFVLTLEIFNEQLVGDHVMFVADVIDASASAAAEFTPLTLANSGFPYAG